MRAERRFIGESHEPLVVMDEVTGDIDGVVAMAIAMAPFPPVAAGNYPGLRRFITAADDAASGYVERLLEGIAPYIGGAFGATAFDLDHASFSMVTTPPAALQPQQRAPHFDSVDPNHLAILHYLRGTDATGTAFYRQRATGIERVGAADVDRFALANRQRVGSAEGYIAGSDDAYEQIGRVDAVPDRLLIYRGALLHSGIIAADAPLDPDPARGRLTANIFVTMATA